MLPAYTGKVKQERYDEKAYGKGGILTHYINVTNKLISISISKENQDGYFDLWASGPSLYFAFTLKRTI